MPRGESSLSMAYCHWAICVVIFVLLLLFLYLLHKHDNKPVPKPTLTAFTSTTNSFQPEDPICSLLTEEPQTPTEKTNPGYFLIPSGSTTDYFVLQDSCHQDTDI